MFLSPRGRTDSESQTFDSVQQSPRCATGVGRDRRWSLTTSEGWRAAAGLSRITFHDLRHSYATGALKAGINPKVVSERIGHADVGYFLQTYAHVLTNDDREAAEQAATFLIGNAWETYDEHDNSDG
jgi:integrase